jgi:predicted enzyme related to lactoylglutathione lyase
MDKTEVGDFGSMSILVDPTGATFALWQAKPRSR